MPRRKPQASLDAAADDFVERDDSEEIERRIGHQVETHRTDDGCIVAESRSFSIRTLPQLLDAIGLPPETAQQDGETEFVVVEFSANVWEQGAKIRDQLRTLPLWQVKARFRPRRPAPAVTPQPLVLRMPQRKPRPLAEPQPGAVLRSFIVPDTQIGFWRDYLTGGLQPFHDRRAIDAAFQVMQAVRPDRVDWLGDALDLPAFQGKFPKGPWLRYLTQPAFVELAFLLWRCRRILDSFGGAHRPIHVVPGNHDARLVKAMIGTDAEEAADLRPVFAPRAAPLLSLQTIIGADELGVQFADPYPDGRIVWNGNIWAMHGDKVGRGGGGTARKYLADSPSMSVVFGHVHRVEMAWATTHSARGEREFLAWSPGCLCRIDGAVPASQSRHDWQQGAGVLEYEPGGREFFAPHQVRIQGGRALWRGQVYEGQDYTDELIKWARSVGWENADDYAGGRRAA